jgi:hypothetical protein
LNSTIASTSLSIHMVFIVVDEYAS